MTPVVFDLDGTLIDSLAGITDAANAVLAERGLPAIGTDLTVGFVGQGERVFVERLIAATDLDPEDTETLILRFVEHYKTAALTTVLMPGVRKALDALKGAGYPLGLVTNKPRAPLGPTLETVGLSGDFDVVLAGDDLPRRKPDPLPLLEATRRLNADHCLYVGDSDIDAETAQRAGQTFIFYTEGIRAKTIDQIPHDIAFSDFADLSSIVERLV